MAWTVSPLDGNEASEATEEQLEFTFAFPNNGRKDSNGDED